MWGRVATLSSLSKTDLQFYFAQVRDSRCALVQTIALGIQGTLLSPKGVAKVIILVYSSETVIVVCMIMINIK